MIESLQQSGRTGTKSLEEAAEMASNSQIPPPQTKQDPTARPRSSDWAWHVSIGTVVLLLAVAMTVNADGSVSLIFLPDHSLPMICAIRKHFHVDCLTCGMTRSVISLVHGQWEQSIMHHRLGWLALLGIALQIPYGIQLRLRGENAWQPREGSVVTFWVLGISLLVLARFGWV
ncbi:MAG: DUF2752 domain-containing protein [Planctomycetota bacterium]